RIFQDELGSLSQTFAKNDHPARGANRVRKSFHGLRIIGDVRNHRHLQQHALRASPFFRRRLAAQRGTRAAHASHCTRFGVWRRFHSSSPQKSIAGATSSMPYSQPSGRWLPFQTTIAALLVCEIVFVSASRCSSSSDCASTTMQPYGFTIRVCASTLRRLPAPSSHSRRTGTLEFMRRPRRFSWCLDPRRLFSRSFTGIFASILSC